MIISAITASNCTPQTIVIGRRGTYDTMQIAFDLSFLIENYGNGTAVLAVKRSQDESAYPAVVTQEDATLLWTVNETDTAYVGSGECQLMWYVDGGLAKTIIYPMVVMRDILQTAEQPPDGYENWVEHLTELGAETQQNAQNAAQSASDASTAKDDAVTAKEAAENAQQAAETAVTHYPKIENNYWMVWDVDSQSYVSTGIQAEGEDGYSPEVTITTITGGHRVTITDKDHPQGQTFDVMDGQGGGTGDYDELTNRPRINGHTLTGNQSASDLRLGTYSKPADGIPKTDLAQDVQQSLRKADTALQTAPVQSVAGKTGAVNLGAGDVGFDSSEEYNEGTVGAELSELNRQLSDIEENQIPELKNAISDIMRGDRMLFDGRWLAPSGNWVVDNDRSFYVFPVSPNDSISIKSTSLAAYYTFLKTFSTPVARVVADYATGYSNFVARGREYTVTAPNDAHYFLLGKTLDGNDVTPIWARNGNYDYVKTTIDNYNDNASGIVTINSYPTAGYVNVTSGIETGGTWVTTDFYPSENIKSIFLKAYQIPGIVAIASFYDVNKNFIYAVDTISGTSGNGEKSGYLDLSGVPNTARFVRFSTNDGATHYVVINYGITNIVLANYDSATEAQNNIISSNVRIETFNGNGFVKYVDGSINAGANWCYTDYLSAKNVVSMRSKAYQFPGSVALVAFYDEDKGFISAVDAYDGMTGQGVKEGNISISQIPANAVFMRFSSYVSADGKYVSVKYDYTQSMKELISVVPELQSLLRNFDIYGEKLTGYPFTMTFIGDSLTYGQTYVADQGTPNYAYKNKANYPDVFSKLMELDSKTVIAIPGANPGGVWSEKRSEISAIQNQFVIVWLGTNGGLTDTVDTDCVGDDVDSYANTNTGNYGKIVKTLVSNGNKVFLAQLCYTTHSATSNPVIVKLADRFDCSAIELTPDDIADLNQDKYHTAYNGYINSVHFNSIGYNHVAGLFYNKVMNLVYDDPAQFEIYMADV